MVRRILAYICDEGLITETEVKKLTHINLSFGRIFEDAHLEVEKFLPTKMQDIKKWREWNPDLKICLSIQNGDYNSWSKCASDDTLLKKLVQSFVDAIKKYDLDGIDLDWEYPCVPSNGMLSSNADRENFTKLVDSMRKTFDKEFTGSNKKLITIAAGADVYFTHIVDLPKVSNDLDYICLMTYDLKCGFHALSGHHTALYSNLGDYFRNSADQAMKLFVNAGVPKDKLLIGAAFYSRKWENVPDVNHGFLQLTPKGGGYGPGFDELDESYINKNGYVRYWDDEAKAPYLFNGSTFISYDDEESVKLKTLYVKENDYGGIFYWVHGLDKKDKLFNAIVDNF